MSAIPAAELTRAHIGRHIRIHRETGDVRGVLNGIDHDRTTTTLHIAEWTPDKHEPGGTYQAAYYHDDDRNAVALTVTVGQRYISPGEVAATKPERSLDRVAQINSRFD